MYTGPATIDAILRQRVQERPDHSVIRFPDSHITYGALDERSRRAGALFGDLGIVEGDRVAVMLRNGPDFIDVWFGLARIGAIEVPINTALKGDLLAYMLRQSGSRVIVVDAEWLERIATVAPTLPDLQHILVVGEATAHVVGPVLHDLHEAMDASPIADLAPRTDAYSRSVVLYTSGTTGPSKGVVLTHNANFRLCRTLSRATGFQSGEVLFTAFPLFHVAARYVSVLGAMLTDGSIVVHDRFSASRFWDLCATEGVTAIHYLGSLLTMLLKQPETDRDRDHDVRVAYGAGAPLPVWQDVERRFGLRLFELYGMTETGAVTMNRDGAYRTGSCGTTLPDCEVAIHDEHDRPVAPGVEGEIVVRPNEPHIMIEEYLGMPEATLEAFRNLWFHTGDRGHVDEDGYLWFAGRQKDAIRRRGENVSAYEVEVVVADHPEVMACAVIGIEDEISGEEVMAVIVPQPGAQLDPIALLDHCQDRLPYFAVPRYVRVTGELPMNTSQRVEKYKLRAEGVTPDTWDREAHDYEVRR